MPSFDIVSKINIQEVDNAVNSVLRELTNRYDFKGAVFSVELKAKENIINISADSEYKLEAVRDSLKVFATKRGIDVKALEFCEPQEAGEQIRAGKLRVLAQISNKPLVGFPNIPNLKQAGFDISTTPQMRAVMAPPDFPKEALAYYEDLFSKLTKSASWDKYMEDYQLEEGYLNGAALGKSITAIETDLKNQYQQAGVKTVR